MLSLVKVPLDFLFAELPDVVRELNSLVLADIRWHSLIPEDVELVGFCKTWVWDEWGGVPDDIEHAMQADFSQIWRCCAGMAWVKWNANRNY